MKYLGQFLWILLCSFAGELLHLLLPFTVPAGIYGLALLFFVLELHLLELPQVEECARFLIEIMPVVFVPAAVGLMEDFDALKPVLLPVFAILVVSTVLVMGTAGRVTQALLRAKKAGKAEERT